jgi:hypothetical protein
MALAGFEMADLMDVNRAPERPRDRPRPTVQLCPVGQCCWSPVPRVEDRKHSFSEDSHSIDSGHRSVTKHSSNSSDGMFMKR